MRWKLAPWVERACEVIHVQSWVIFLSSSQIRSVAGVSQLNLALPSPVLQPLLLHILPVWVLCWVFSFFLFFFCAGCLTNNLSCYPHNSSCDRYRHCTGLDCPSQSPASHSLPPHHHLAPVVSCSFTFSPKASAFFCPSVSSASPFAVSFSCLFL